MDKDKELRKKKGEQEENGKHLQHFVEPGLFDEVNEEAKAVRRAVEVQEKNNRMEQDMELIVLCQKAAREERRRQTKLKVSQLKEQVGKRRKANKEWVLKGGQGGRSRGVRRGRSGEPSRRRSGSSRAFRRWSMS